MRSSPEGTCYPLSALTPARLGGMVPRRLREGEDSVKREARKWVRGALWE